MPTFITYASYSHSGTKGILLIKPLFPIALKNDQGIGGKSRWEARRNTPTANVKPLAVLVTKSPLHLDA